MRSSLICVSYRSWYIISAIHSDEAGTALLLTVFALLDIFGTACNVTGDGALTLMTDAFEKRSSRKPGKGTAELMKNTLDGNASKNVQGVIGKLSSCRSVFRLRFVDIHRYCLSYYSCFCIGQFS